MKSKLVLPLSLIALLSSSIPARTAEGKDEKKKEQIEKAAAAFKNVGVEQFEKLRADKENVVLDVRTSKEFADGHIPGAVNLDVNAADFEQKVGALEKNRVYLVHCAAGVRSAKACEKMGRLSFPKLYNLEGGFKAWEKAGNKADH